MCRRYTPNSVRFERLHLQNYGVFAGSNDFVFDRHRTLIVGAGDTGKTTIVNALAHLGPAPGVQPHYHADPSEMSVIVSTSGDRTLVKRYGSVMFLRCESVLMLVRNQGAILAEVLDRQHRKAVRDEARDIFQTLVGRTPGKAKAHKGLNHDGMSMGVRVCLSFAFVFAVRKVLNLDLPAVFDKSYACLDSPLRDGVRAFLREQKCQQILLGTESEFREEDKAHYKLDRVD